MDTCSTCGRPDDELQERLAPLDTRLLCPPCLMIEATVTDLEQHANTPNAGGPNACHAE